MSASGWFTTEIQNMMHGCGDCRKPLLESASLIESLVFSQLTAVLEKLCDLSQLRGSRHIGIEDILFLMHKDKVKLRRLIRYVELTDMRGTRAYGSEEDDSSLDSVVSPAKKRTKLCYDFLNSIDVTGELTALFHDYTHDDIKLERLLRAECSSRTMDQQQYKEFCEARQASFGRKIKLQKFKDWLISDSDIKLNSLALEIMSYLAFETVAQIVDLALLVKKDQSMTASHPIATFIPISCPELQYSDGQPSSAMTSSSCPTSPISPAPRPDSSFSSQLSSSALVSSGSSLSSTKSLRSRRKSGNRLSCDLASSNGITPAHIKEVIRRYNTHLSPFILYAKQPIGGARPHLFCC